MKKWIPALVIVILMILAFLTEVHQLLNFENLKNYRHELKTLVTTRPLSSVLIYMIIYTISTALSLPTGIFLSILGGFLFPQPFSTLYVLASATVGASCIFLAAKTALGSYLARNAQPTFQKMRKGFQENAVNYLLFLRLVPIFPFWLVNLAPAFFNVPLFTFVWTTFIGIIPGAFAYTQAGVGLGKILDSGKTLTFNAILNTQMKIALIALGALVLLPVIIKHFRKEKK